MNKFLKKIGSFFGFIISVWFLGGVKNSNASFNINSDDLRSASQEDNIKTFDNIRFARTGDLIEDKKIERMFAYLCATLDWYVGEATTYFYVASDGCDFAATTCEWYPNMD